MSIWEMEMRSAHNIHSKRANDSDLLTKTVLIGVVVLLLTSLLFVLLEALEYSK